MRQNNNISNTRFVTSRQSSKRFRKSPDRLIHHQSMDFNVRVKPEPSSYIICTNISSISV